MKRVFSLGDKFHGAGPVLFCWQNPQGNCIATSGANNVVNIFDRHGDLKEQVQLQGRCCVLTWDKNGDVLAAINDKTSQIVLWDANTYKTAHLEISFKEPLSVLVWSKVSMCLAVGTTKGNLLIYNHQSSRKIPIVGKHTKRITCGGWSDHDLLAMAGEDKVLTISNAEGDTVRQISLRQEPQDIKFSEMKQDERSSGENTVSLIVGKKTLFLYNLNDPENPIELAFQQRYGHIVTYRWFGDGYMLIGFSHGYFVVISTHMKEIGQELYQSQNHKSSLNHVAVNNAIGKAASCGDNTIKIHELSDPKETFAVITVDDERSVDRLEWTEDGQLLAASTPQGTVHVYLTRLPILGHSYNTRLIYLTSLLEVTITDSVEKEKPVTITAEVEPSFLSLGPYHFALGMNNQAWFYSFGETGPELVGEREYLGTVQSMKMNADYACVLHEGKLQLHTIESDGGEHEGRETLLLPDPEQASVHINCLALTTDFLVYGTDGGGLFYFLLDDWQTVNEYHHSHSIRKIYPDPAGSRLVFVDDKCDGYIYNPVDDTVLEVVDMPGKVQSVIWDKAPGERGVFAACDDERIYTFVHVQESIRGARVSLVGTTGLPAGQFPILLYGGELTCQTQGGKIASLTLSTHDLGGKLQGHTADEAIEALGKCLALRRFKDAWLLCQLRDDRDQWLLLARAALENLDLDTATEVYRHLRDVGMVWSLEGVQDTEDRRLLAGHVALILKEYDLAQEHYLGSAEPAAALDMRRDLLQWDQALQLATKLAPHQVSHISREYAQQLEFVGEYSSALLHYERGMPTGADQADGAELCQNGVARMSIRCGDIRKGVEMAERLPSDAVKRECAEILEGLKQYVEAAVLFEKGGSADRAASLYIRLKNWQKIGELLPNITSPKILLQYAKAKEADSRYKEAADAYGRARDYDNLTRILLDHLKNPEEAVKIVRESQSVEGAKMVARFFQKLNDFASAIQFLVMSRCNDEAFQLAQQYGKMSVYTEVLGTGAAVEEYRSVAHYYENEKNHHEAGKFYFLAKDYTKAVKHLLKVAGREEDAAIRLATDVVGEAQDAGLTQQLIGHLLGEADGVPKDAKHLFKLYMACGQYREAAKTATIIAREEQNAGNYRNAHDVLFSMYQELHRHRIRIPAEMITGLAVLHSYILVKIHVRRGDHLRAARMLVRVANNISKFPAHVVPILTSTIIECHRSGLKNSAFGYATMLMRPEYRNQIDLKYKKKIEAIVRKPQKVEEEEDCTPCPYCANMLPASELFCSECKNNLPYCVVTGQHVTVTDLTVCPKCNFPASLAEFVKHLEQDPACPMCSEAVPIRELAKITDISTVLQQDTD